MNITIGRSKHQIQELQEETRQLKAKIQELVVPQDNILTVQVSETPYSGNRYKTYDQAIAAVALAYAGGADWGNLQVGSIVDLRASYIVGQGIKVKAIDEEGAEPELAFIKRFMETNQLDHELPQDLAREAEIEGKTLIKIFPIEYEVAPNKPAKEADIGIRWVSWTTNKYKVQVAKDDYSRIEKITWKPESQEEQTLLPEQCVYKRLAGRLDIPNETLPRVAKCLTQIENLDMALRDWRQINSFYAAPTPYFECLTPEQAKKTNDAIKEMNWKIGKAMAGTAKFDYKQPNSEGQRALESEIITLMKLISGTTGVPIHFLGAPELTTKYGAANEGLLELIAMSTSKEREIWRACYSELLTKAMKMWNETEKKTPLDPSKIIVEIPQITKEQWDRIISTWLPLYRENAIQLATLLEQVPGLNVKAEVDAKAEADASELAKLKEENTNLKFDKNVGGVNDNNE